LIEALKNHIGVVTHENEELLKRLEAWEAFVRRILQLWKFNVNIEEIKMMYNQLVSESWSRVEKVKSSYKLTSTQTTTITRT